MGGIDGSSVGIDGDTWSCVLIIMQMCPEIE